MRILIAEDDVPVAGFIRKALENENYQVEIAVDGAIAGRLLSSAAFDLVVLDLNLPEVDGTALLQSVRKDNADLPVIVLTARNSVEERVRLLDLGADDFLTKPFSFSELSARVRAVLRRKGAAS